VLSLFCSYNVFVVMKFVCSNLDTMGGRRVRVRVGLRNGGIATDMYNNDVGKGGV